VAPSTTVMTDSWAGYTGIDSYDDYPLKHFTVNHDQHFIDPITGASTQKIECMWNRLRLNLIREARRISLENLDSALAFEWWLGLQRDYKKHCYKPIQIFIESYFNSLSNLYA
jgi:hypothetical protein